MGKNSEIKMKDHIFQMLEQEEEKIKTEASEYYPDGVIADFTPSSKEEPLAPLLTLAKQAPAPQTPTQDQLMEACQGIRISVMAGKKANAEIQLNKGRQLSDKQVFPLGNTVVKVLPTDSDQPFYLFIRAGDTLDASIFLGGDNAMGILLIKDENGTDYFLRLAEFHLLSLREDPDPRKEIGLMTSYLWLTAKVYSSIIFAANLNPIKNLLLSEWLKAEWQRAKDATSKPTNEAEGGNSDG